MEKITRRVMELARCYGADVLGIVTTEMLAEGPPSTDLTYVLPEAKSAVSFALPLDQELIAPWFNKQNHAAHFQNNIRTNVMASGISMAIANYLKHKGHPAAPLEANTDYRTDTKNGIYDEIPPMRCRLFRAFRKCADKRERGCHYPEFRRNRGRINSHRSDSFGRKLLR